MIPMHVVVNPPLEMSKRMSNLYSSIIKQMFARKLLGESSSTLIMPCGNEEKCRGVYDLIFADINTGYQLRFDHLIFGEAWAADIHHGSESKNSMRELSEHVDKIDRATNKRFGFVDDSPMRSMRIEWEHRARNTCDVEILEVDDLIFA